MSKGLSAPGSSVYSSDTMYVGDGTWDSQRNTFLLPNLQGPNFETMRYNGMGNRFRSMVSYKALITAHGVLAGITFLFIIPAAIFMARFYHRNPHTALKFHIWLQVLAVLLSTAAIVCCFLAVGLERSLTNPHHGIGVALYTLVMVQALGGSVIHRLEKGKERFKIPLKLMIHQWLGRTIALLGFAQVPLGLTLYGSPLALFILFAVWTFILFILYFVLSYRNQPELDFDDRSTYVTDRTYSTRRTGMRRVATASAAGAGLAGLGPRRQSRSMSRSRRGGTVISSRPDSQSRVNESEFTESYLSDEKYGGNRQKGHTWRDRLLGAGAAAGGIFAMKKLFSRKPKRPPTETGSDFSYSRPLGPSEVTQTDISRLEEGRAPESPANRRDDWRRDNPQASGLTESSIGRGHRPTRSGGSIDSFDSRTSLSEETEMRPRDHSYGLKDGVATLGVFGFLKHSLSRRSKKKEDDHVEEMRQQDLEEERVARMNSQRRKKYTGDGAPRKGNRPPSTILSESDMTGITPSVARPLPMDSTLTPSINPGGRPPRAGVYSVLSDSGSEAYDSPGGRHHSRRRTGDRPIIPAGTAAAATVTSMGSPSKKERRGSRDDVASPPVSVKVKMHNDGRHVTLRRLNEEEAAAEREARRRERKNKNRAGSVSSLSAGGGERWRRTEAMERAQAEEMAQQAGVPPPPPGPPPVFNQGQNAAPGQTLFPPPPIPAAADTVLSSPPGTQFNGTETDLSNYDSNRRRRRAERAQAKQARLGGGSRVEFS
ncbi:membrane protein [Pyrenophora teres f. maculata]|nr:membrane protein [Pyrenophora teres f. maculata]